MQYHLVTLGCQMNKSDSERVRTVIERMGYTWTDDEETANLLGILACSVRQKAIDKVYTRIHKWNKWKQNKNLLSFVTGCVLPADKDKFLTLFDLVFTMEELPGLYDMIRQYGMVTPVGIAGKHVDPVLQDPLTQPVSDIDFSDINIVEIEKQNGNLTNGDLKPLKPRDQSAVKLGGFWTVKPRYTSQFEAFIPIQNGCDKFCTFCAVPYTRGREVSRSSEEILSEVKQLMEQGYKSITLLGQNVNSYGKDKKGDEISFPELLKKIGQLGDSKGHECWVYFTSPHPKDMSEDVIKVISRYSCLAKQIHLPIQSGDEKVLIKMNRNHTVEKYRKIVNAIHKWIPDATIFTDIIVGFTGETDSQFLNTRKAISEFKYNMAYIAMYSPRPGATSSRWKDDISHEIKKERLHILSEELKIYTRQYNENMVGKKYIVLVTGHDRKEGFLSGYTEGKIIVRFPSHDKKLIGKFVEIKIISAADFSVEGELIPIKEKERIG